MYVHSLLKILCVFAIGAVALCENSSFSQENFSFAVIGDIPRIGDAAIEPDLLPFMRLIDEVNRSDAEFIIHVGDFISSGIPCSDEAFERWLSLCQMFDMPVFFIPGDNEWTDCHTKKAGGYDPLERLRKLRTMFFTTPFSLGKRKMPVQRQSDSTDNPRFRKFVENFQWTMGNILFVSLNVQGSNNNFARTPEMDAEYFERNEAVNAYLHESFALAKNNDNQAVVVVIQANPKFDTAKRAAPDKDGFRDFRTVLEEETIAFAGKPVILLHGDSHYFRIDKPLRGTKSKRRIENFTRVETFGTPDVHWLLATVDNSNPNMFIFEPRIIKDNVIDHSK